MVPGCSSQSLHAWRNCSAGTLVRFRDVWSKFSHPSIVPLVPRRFFWHKRCFHWHLGWNTLYSRRGRIKSVLFSLWIWNIPFSTVQVLYNFTLIQIYFLSGTENKSLFLQLSCRAWCKVPETTHRLPYLLQFINIKTMQRCELRCFISPRLVPTNIIISLIIGTRLNMTVNIKA